MSMSCTSLLSTTYRSMLITTDNPLPPSVPSRPPLPKSLFYFGPVDDDRAAVLSLCVQVRDVHSLAPQVLKGLAPGRQYCVSVCIYDILVNQESDYSRPVCVITPDIHTKRKSTQRFVTGGPLTSDLCVSHSQRFCFLSADLWLLPVSFLLVFLLVLLMVLVKTGYICLRRMPPVVLVSKSIVFGCVFG